MDKHVVRQTLEQIAAFLELKGEDPFRVRAYETAARALAGFPGDVAGAVEAGTLERVKGMSPATLEVVRELLVTGRSTTLDELREQIPPGLVEMLRIPGLGVAKVRQIHEALGIESLPELEAAALDGRLARLPRFGAKTAANVHKGITFLREASEFRLYHHALAEAEGVQRALAGLEGVQRVELAGSVRRRREVIRDIDLVMVAAPGSQAALIKRLGQAPGVTEFAGGEGTVTLRFASGSVVDVFLATPHDFGLAWVRATGAAEHLADLDARARARGVALAPGGAFPDEESVYRAVGLAWIPPELREGAGECDAAAEGRLPKLIEQRDLRGLIHCHTNYSDGVTTVAEWARACAEAGYEWIGVTDHSQSSVYAGGLTPEAIGAQRLEIDAANRDGSLGGARVLQGVEADILADGTLDYDSDTLDRFDFVIGSIHTRFGMNEAEMTRRVLSAMDDPHLAIIGHPTGRLLLAREPFAIDLEKVFAKAALRGIAVEVNADPHRLDLDWRLVRQARAAGVTISLGADAHSTSGMSNVTVGLGIARKAWVEARDVLNTRDADSFLAFTRQRRAVPA
ncbi:MAG TPA: PHP domain-containing protein [Gemmatimonadales bacterium]|nr:PHP domain-containing protein [Gemmatimonadales bacterium]